MFGEEFDRVRVAFCFGLVCEHPIASVVFEGRAQVPSVGSVGVPGLALIGFLMNYDLCAGRCHWSAVEVKMSLQHLVGRDVGVAAGVSEEVEGKCSLWEESIPKMHGKILIGAAEARHEMIFPGAYCSFRCIAAMHVRGYQLKSYTVLVVERL